MLFYSDTTLVILLLVIYYILQYHHIVIKNLLFYLLLQRCIYYCMYFFFYHIIIILAYISSSIIIIIIIIIYSLLYVCKRNEISMPPTAPFAIAIASTAFVVVVGTYKRITSCCYCRGGGGGGGFHLCSSPTPSPSAATGLACFSARYLVRITSVGVGGAITRSSAFSPTRVSSPSPSLVAVPLRVFLLFFQCFSDNCTAFFVLSITTEQVAVAGQKFVKSDSAIARGILFLRKVYPTVEGKKVS